MDVGIRDLRNGLSRFIDLVKAGQEITVTERGKPVARIVGSTRRSTLDELIALGLARPPLRPRPAVDTYVPVKAAGSVSDLVGEQRR